MTDRPPSPARRAALLRLPVTRHDDGSLTVHHVPGYGTLSIKLGSDYATLTPAGLSAARAIREKGE